MMKDPEHLKITTTAGATGANRARKQLAKCLNMDSTDQSFGNAMALAISEWVTNLGSYPARQTPIVNISLYKIGITRILEFEDFGSPFDTVMDWINKEDALELSEHGMGLDLIAHYFPYKTYSATNGCNRLRLQWHIASRQPRPLILLVDDDPIIRAVYSAYLAAHYRIILADSAEEALHLLDHGGIDLVLSDINMPEGASGLDLCLGIREIQELETVPVVFITGRNDSHTRQAAHGLAIDDFLLKPVKKSTLLDCLNRVIHNAQFVRNRLGNRFDQQLTDLLHPQLPSRKGSFISQVSWWTAEAGGGDILFSKSWETETLIILADLMGHGTQAKFFSHALSGYLRGTLSAVVNPSPQEVLNRLNSAFADDPILSQTLATAIAVLIQDDGRCVFANASHPQPLLVSENIATPIDIGGPLLGLSTDTSYQTVELTILPGQRLVLYSDGLSEIGKTPDRHHENFQEFVGCLKGTSKSDLSTASRQFEALIKKKIAGECSDDITVSFIEFTD